jgi:hypothetical protein
MGLTTRSYSTEPESFKDDGGRWRTKSLFVETNEDEKKYPSIFTLGDKDKDGRVSMRSIYLECGDPTEYKAAISIFGSLDCWERLCKAPFFKPHLDQWRSELQRKIKSQAVDTISDISIGVSSNATQLSAAKWLAQQEWVGNTPKANKVGRPLQPRDPEQALKEGLLDAEEENDDYNRIFKASDN